MSGVVTIAAEVCLGFLFLAAGLFLGFLTYASAFSAVPRGSRS